MHSSSKRRVLINFFQLLGLVFTLLFLVKVNDPLHAAQNQTSWSPQQTIPGFHPETIPPVLLADKNRTVHALSSQWVGEDSDQPVLAIMYNQWTLAGGWTKPNDIIFPPLKAASPIVRRFPR